MIRLIISNSARFIFLVIFQVLILNNIQLYNVLNPYFYVLFILLLPLDISAWAILFLSFFLGLSVDVFSDTGGIHAAASVFMAFCRPLVLIIVTPRGGYEHEPSPSLSNMGARWFITYSSILVLLHHLLLFNIEVFRFNEFPMTLLRIVLSSVFTMTLIIISQYFFTSGRSK